MYQKNLPRRTGLTPEFKDDGLGAEDIFDAVGRLLVFNYNQDGAPDDVTRSCPTDVRPSSYYGRGPYDMFFCQANWFDVVHAAEQRYGTVAPNLNWHLLLSCTKKLIRDLGVPVEKIDACKRGCMLYWKDEIDLDYFKFCGEARYKPMREQNPNRKKTSYAILRLHGMKSHDCHVFMQKLIPIAFREILPAPMWSALTEVSLLFQILCSMTLDVNKVQELKASVATILCNFEKNFPPAFFNLMEHLIVHLSYEARVGGPVQYRWMYPLRENGASKKMQPDDSQRHIIEMYILCNCEAMTSYYKSFLNELYEHHHSIDPNTEELVATSFNDWFKHRVKFELNYTDDELLKLHYWDPTTEVTTLPY
ncbi:UNVERIFIED_CONTAM: hypothetical protein Scaly_1914000 [Sesamum calycinum]|uniref:DUF4218 domain-containing protein n=1 Tax=Sesamum calycinum TaxID=2727403 RepID=A0AAW2NFY4_9LAMI